MFTIKITIAELQNTTSPARYVTDIRADGSHMTRYVDEAKTWKTSKGAQRWIDERQYNVGNKFARAEVVRL